MTYLYIIGIAVGLAMDALAVSVTSGFLIKNLKIHHAFRIAFFFGGNISEFENCWKWRSAVY